MVALHYLLPLAGLALRFVGFGQLVEVGAYYDTYGLRRLGPSPNDIQSLNGGSGVLQFRTGVCGGGALPAQGRALSP